MTVPTLLAVAHGSPDPRSPAAMHELVDLVAETRPDLRVRLAFLDHNDPRVGDALSAGSDDVVVVPLLLTSAYHDTVDLPALVRAARAASPGRRILQARALGPHRLLEAALARLLDEVVERPPAGPKPRASACAHNGVGRSAASRNHGAWGVVVAAAGSSDPAAGAVVEHVAGRIARHGWPVAVAAFASAGQPDVASALRRVADEGLRPIVASYFLAPGTLHDRVRVGGEAVPVTPTLAGTPEVAELVLTRFQEALSAGRR